MKVALITDTHWGVRNDHAAFIENSKQFLDDVFFPTLAAHGVTSVIHLGDIVDRRKYINYVTAKRLREDFLEKLHGLNMDVHILAGNHDVYYKNTNEVNSLNELIRNRYPFKIYDQYAETVDFGGTPIFMMPWLCEENAKQIMEQKDKTNAQIAMGHLEIAGFEMYKGSIASHGEDRSVFDNFDVVCSGHYHHRSSDGHIFYLGSHGQFNWADYNDARGFHLLDTEDRSLQFITNPYELFKKVWYDDTDKSFADFEGLDYDQYKGCILKVIVQNRTNHYMFDKFLEKIEAVNPVELMVVNDHLNLNQQPDEAITNEAEDTLTVFKKYIEKTEGPVDKVKLEAKLIELYHEAMELE